MHLGLGFWGTAFRVFGGFWGVSEFCVFFGFSNLIVTLSTSLLVTLCGSLFAAPTVTFVGVSENKGTLFWGPYNKDPTL